MCSHYVIPILIGFLTACDSAEEPEFLVLGIWDLVIMNETPVPGSIQDPDEPGERLFVESGILEFEETGIWSFSIVVDSEILRFTGNYSVSGETLSIVWTGITGSDEDVPDIDELVEMGATLTVGEWTRDRITLILALDVNPWFECEFRKT